MYVLVHQGADITGLGTLSVPTIKREQNLVAERLTLFWAEIKSDVDTLFHRFSKFPF